MYNPLPLPLHLATERREEAGEGGGLRGAAEKVRQDRRWGEGGGVFQKGSSLSVKSQNLDPEMERNC